MATNNNTQTPQAPETTQTQQAAQKDDRVDLFIPRGSGNDEPNAVIAVNGVNYVLPKGKTSKVPKHIAAEYYRSQKAQEIVDKHVDAMQQASK